MVLTVCLRSAFGVGTFILYNWGLTMVPLALCVILFNLAPFWTSLLAKLVNDEHIFKLEYLAMIICFGLVICLTLLKD